MKFEDEAEDHDMKSVELDEIAIETNPEATANTQNIAGFDPFNQQTTDLLDVKDNKVNLVLQQLYYSPKCSWFYIFMLVLSCGLIIVTIIDGFKVCNTAWFILLEFLLNFLITVDFVARIKMVGCSKYFKNGSSGHLRWWHIFDAIVVVLCLLLFAVMIFSKSGIVKGFDEAAEEILLVIWSIWQSLRMINIAKK